MLELFFSREHIAHVEATFVTYTLPNSPQQRMHSTLNLTWIQKTNFGTLVLFQLSLPMTYLPTFKRCDGGISPKLIFEFSLLFYHGWEQLHEKKIINIMGGKHEWSFESRFCTMVCSFGSTVSLRLDRKVYWSTFPCISLQPANER